MKDAPKAAPLMPEIGLMAFVPDTWDDGVWQLRHQILTRLSRYFNVVWANPPIGWRKSIRSSPLISRFHVPDYDNAPGLEIYQHPKWAAKFYRPKFIADLTEAARVRAGLSELKKRGSEIRIGYLWRPQFASSLWAGNFDKRCYHIDDEYSFSVVDTPIDARERRIIEDVDQVFIHSPGMMEKKGNLNPNTDYIPNGVDYDAYTKSYNMPEDLKEISAPIVAYIGVIKSMIDWQLVATLVRQLPELSFVFIGPDGQLDSGDKQAIACLRKLPNAHFLGNRPVDTLPAYTAYADIGIMPYRKNGYTKYIFPLKVNEYLAAGKPTIGTPIRTLQDYSTVVDLASTSEEWCDALQRNLRAEYSREIMIKARKAVAREYDWQISVDRIARSICKLSGSRYVDRLDNVTSTK